MTTTETTTSTDQVQPSAELLHVPAEDVVIEDNVRTIADVTASFLASVKRHGVLLPVIGYRDAEGRVVVRDGQIRVLAAREAGTVVPVLVTDRSTARAKRIAEQLVANEQRNAMSDGDRLTAYRQLSLDGMSDAAIARETGHKREDIKATLSVAKSDTAIAVVTDHALSLDEALIFAEFEDDADAIAQLRSIIERGEVDDLDYWAERIRQDRARAAAVGTLTAELEAKGVRVVSDSDTAYDLIRNLTDAADDAGERLPLTEEAHAACPGHAVTIRDWGTPTAAPVCTTPEAHHPLYRPTVVATPNAPATPEEEEAAREAERIERRRVRENNKAWDAADALRRKFVHALLQRKTLPKDWTLFAATSTTRFSYMVRNDTSNGARTLLGLDPDNHYGIHGVAEWVEQNPAKAAHVTLAFVLSAFENAADRSWWRSPSAEGTAYLTQLAAWGYRLTDVEKIATGQEPDTATEEDAADAA